MGPPSVVAAALRVGWCLLCMLPEAIHWDQFWMKRGVCEPIESSCAAVGAATAAANGRCNDHVPALILTRLEEG